MSEKPLERLNYFNGQRLQAGDFRLEQDYHMRVRRWLNRSLYTAGIATGLEIYPVAGVAAVRVNPGLAIDPIGREIILLEAREIPVMHDIGQGSALAGSYVVIRYAEELTARQDANCAPGACGDQSAAGAPSRVLADPVIECVPDLPQESSGKILLGRVVLAAGCGSIASIDLSARDSIGKSADAFVRQYALEGEREVAAMPSQGANPTRVRSRLHFHVRGRQPASITLFLKAMELSALHYTEVGGHTHALSVTGSTGESQPALDPVQTSHFHGAGELVTGGVTGQQAFTLIARKAYVGNHADNAQGAFFLYERNWPLPIAGMDYSRAPENVLDDVNGSIGGGDHGHAVMGNTEPKGPDLRHTHALSGSGSSGAVATDPAALDPRARIGIPLKQLSDLRIAIDGIDRTEEIRAQIQRTAPADQNTAWMRIGDGTSTHPLADAGRAAIAVRLDYLRDFSANLGEHVIEFSVDLKDDGSANGGRILYNLYVE